MSVYTVSEFVEAVSAYLEQGLGTVSVQGEVSGFRIAKDTLVYFELKDETSRLLCFMLKWQLQQPIEDGMEIRVIGTPKLFKGSGGFHLRTVGVELVGAGALQRAFELTKKKLEQEGLFNPEFKKSLPRFPETIGIVTSQDAAAFTDVVQILNNRWGGLRIVLAHAGVQGPGAIRELVAAIRWFNENADVRPDVLIVTRGGGSLEDLQAFNSEEVCRAIFSSRIPVVCGVGHERDTTLAELVADVRASTPSNAAERVAPDRRDVTREVMQMTAHIEQTVTSEIESSGDRLDRAVAVMQQLFGGKLQTMRTLLFDFLRASSEFEQNLALMRQRAVQHALLLNLRFTARIVETKEQIKNMARLLSNLGPEATLKRGYTITLHAGKPIRSAKTVTRGNELTTRFADGQIISTIT